MILHAIDVANRNPFSELTIVSPDTNVFVFWSLITKNYVIKQFFCTGTFSGTEFDDNNTEKYTIFTNQGRYITSTTKTTSVFRFPTQADGEIRQTRKIFLLDSA